MVVRNIMKEYPHDFVTVWIQHGNGRIRGIAKVISLSDQKNKNSDVRNRNREFMKRKGFQKKISEFEVPYEEIEQAI